MHYRNDSLDLTTTFTTELEPLIPATPVPARSARFLVLLRGRGGVQVAELGPAVSRILGRASPADLIVEDPSLSRRHARIRAEPNGVRVEDLGSKNGTSCAGVAVESMLVQPGMEVALGNVVMMVRHTGDIERRGFDDFERFLHRIDDELLRARVLTRTLSLLLLRGLTHASTDAWWLRVRAELRPIDTIAVYAPGVLAILLPELGAPEARFIAQTLVRKQPQEPTLVCGVATLGHGAQTSDALIQAASRASRAATLDRPVVLSDAGALDSAHEPLIVNEAMRDIYRVARRVASHTAPVLILGETGTGKELVARHIHEAGVRRDRPFRAINCGAIPPSLLESVLFGHERGAFTGASETRKGVFEEAHGGTLFLDEIGELPLIAQAALLRVLETKQLTRVGGTRAVQLDVRIVSATHCDLDTMLENKTFRADLYHRLNLLTLHVPPLRERSDEIESLALSFLHSQDIGPLSSARALSTETLASLRGYAWPGNVRELRNVIERAALLCEGTQLAIDDLPERVRASEVAPDSAGRDETSAHTSGRFADLVRNYEIQLIRDALSSAGGNQTKAAELLDMPLRTLVYKLRSYGLRTSEAKS
ncbi:MAG TPA: sigma 54-interacting transcriptional regulator [Polyangiales bacterium]|nr:sigma 54-interacting transcriptional regulator [Polyangiales bacterium]